MRLIHTSDIHLDSPLNAHLAPKEAKERRRELITSFRSMIDEAERIGAVGVIIAGDLFDSEKVGIRTLDLIMGFIEKASGVEFFYLPGNHEKERLLTSGVSIPENLKIFGTGWTYYKIGDVTLVGRSEIEKGMFSSLSLSDVDTNIVVLHGILADKTDAPEKIGAREISALPVDYLALGHYHTYSSAQISSRCTAVYCGTPEGRGFDEVGDKGYVIIDTDGGNITHTFRKRAMRTLCEIPVDISSAKREIDIENLLERSIKGVRSESLVRILLVGEHTPELRRDIQSLRDRFSSNFFYLEVKDESKLKISPDEYKNDRSLKGEFIRLVMSKSELTEEEKAAVIECGIAALAGEEI